MDSSVTVGPRINYSVTTGPAGLLDIEFVNATSDWVEIKVSPIPGPGTYASMNPQLCITSSAAALAVCAHAEGSLSVTAKEQTPLEKQLVEDHVVNEAGSTTNSVGAPACTQQAPFDWEGVTSQFPHVTSAK